MIFSPGCVDRSVMREFLTGPGLQFEVHDRDLYRPKDPPPLPAVLFSCGAQDNCIGRPAATAGWSLFSFHLSVRLCFKSEAIMYYFNF